MAPLLSTRQSPYKYQRSSSRLKTRDDCTLQTEGDLPVGTLPQGIHMRIDDDPSSFNPGQRRHQISI